jgi:hypothetical protein
MSATDKNVSYSVIFMGELIIGFDKQQVINNLTSITRLPVEEIENKFFDVGRVVIKKTNELKKAKRYHGKFLRAGMAVGIQMDFE